VVSPDDGASNQSINCGSHAYRLAQALTTRIRATGSGQPALFIAEPNTFAFFLGQHKPAISL
jgi:hypothetical protein